MQVLSEVLDRMVASALERKPIDRSDALSVLRSDDDELLHVVAAASVVRRRFFQNRVKLNFLVNMKSGLCPEDCSYCSQRKGSSAEVLRYAWIDAATASDAAERAVAAGAARICLVASGRGPSERDIERVLRTVKEIKERRPKLEICVSLGLLADGQAQRLLDAGVFAYNHNLNTSSSRYAQICSTHTYEDRRATVQMAQKGGLSPCSGAIFGMGESDEEVVDLAYALRALDPDSVPVNFLMPQDPFRLQILLPRGGAAHRRRQRTASPQSSAVGTARGELDLSRRLPHERGPARRRGPGDVGGRGIRDRRTRRRTSTPTQSSARGGAPTSRSRYRKASRSYAYTRGLAVGLAPRTLNVPCWDPPSAFRRSASRPLNSFGPRNTIHFR
jgi:biotin synthase